MSSGSFKNVTDKVFAYIYIYIYIYRVNKDCEYPKNGSPMQGYLMQKKKQQSKMYTFLLKNKKFRNNIYIYIYIYIYIRKNKTGHIRIINLFPSCYVF